MKWVLDSNIGVKWELRDDQSDKARTVRDGYSRGLHELLAPDVFTVECAHAFTRAQRQGRVTTAEGAFRQPRTRTALGGAFSHEWHEVSRNLNKGKELGRQN
jgi:predicted nucleic acid-binding protein